MNKLENLRMNKVGRYFLRSSKKNKGKEPKSASDASSLTLKYAPMPPREELWFDFEFELTILC